VNYSRDALNFSQERPVRQGAILGTGHCPVSVPQAGAMTFSTEGFLCFLVPETVAGFLELMELYKGLAVDP
jgi:hypothetical protein